MSVPRTARRFHAGVLFPLSNIILGTIFLAGMLAVDVLVVAAGLTASNTSDQIWSTVALVLSLLGYAMALSWLCLGINAARPIRIDAEHLYLPTIDLRRGITHLAVPLAEIAGVEMIYRSAPRNSRWQLSIIRLHGNNLSSDSLTSARGSTHPPTGTRASRAAEEIRRSLPSRTLP
ncbi:hypothetical protein EV138_2382 [Kribbella voronezhensis]|uniref:PH (Pleckstrin Homology) domain-containing protein n=1 Tax=Kribbella voronezhensis TaxID=2512212 RepID=A0A4R7TA29_9ACTN|nr:hypothetical protein [Kribbella voronezhensis]TDU88831.1 hypothetical protein EV138_2382 [Kribbella voronezhensis]